MLSPAAPGFQCRKGWSGRRAASSGSHGGRGLRLAEAEVRSRAPPEHAVRVRHVVAVGAGLAQEILLDTLVVAKAEAADAELEHRDCNEPRLEMLEQREVDAESTGLRLRERIRFR